MPRSAVTSRPGSDTADAGRRGERPFVIRDIEISRLSLGCAPLGSLYNRVSPEQSAATLRAALDNGVTLLRHGTASTAWAFQSNAPAPCWPPLPRGSLRHRRRRWAACSSLAAPRDDHLRRLARPALVVRLLGRRRRAITRSVTRPTRARPRRHRLRARSRRPHGPGAPARRSRCCGAGARKGWSARSAPA